MGRADQTALNSGRVRAWRTRIVGWIPPSPDLQPKSHDVRQPDLPVNRERRSWRHGHFTSDALEGSGQPLVGETGLEPARLAPRDPKSRVSAISPLAHFTRARINTRNPAPFKHTEPFVSIRPSCPNSLRNHAYPPRPVTHGRRSPHRFTRPRRRTRPTRLVGQRPRRALRLDRGAATLDLHFTCSNPQPFHPLVRPLACDRARIRSPGCCRSLHLHPDHRLHLGLDPHPPPLREPNDPTSRPD